MLLLLLSFLLPCLRAPNSNRNNKQYQLLLWLVVVCRYRFCLVLLLLWPSQQEQYHRGSVDTTINKQPITIQWQIIYHALVCLLLFRLVVVVVLLLVFVILAGSQQQALIRSLSKGYKSDGDFLFQLLVFDTSTTQHTGEQVTCTAYRWTPKHLQTPIKKSRLRYQSRVKAGFWSLYNTSFHTL